MRKFAIVSGISCVLVSVYLLVGTAASPARIDEKVKDAINKIAAALEKGDNATAKMEAETLVTKIEELNEVMHAFKPRKAKKGATGLGVGHKAGVVTPDGIELKLNAITRDGITAGELKKEGAALVVAAWQTAAIAEVTIIKASDKNRDEWLNLAAEMKTGAKELAVAAKGGSVAEVKTAVTKLNNSCTTCHMKFRK